jgi:predicted nucleic acid-binding protein
MYLFDSSAIAITLKRMREKSVEVLEGEVTLDLASYELGNAIWKGCVLEKLMSSEEAADKAGGIAKILEIMRMERMGFGGGFGEAMELAIGLRLTFYEASYLYMAKSRALTLVTEDEELYGKAKRADVKAIKVSELVNGLGH